MLQYALPQYQLIFLGILLVICLCGTIKLIRTDKGNDKVYIGIASVIFVILISLVVFGKSYLNMKLNAQIIILAIAFIELMLALIIFGLKIVIKSKDSGRIRQFMVGASIIVVVILLLGIIVIFS